MKTAIVTDSNSGITQALSRELGIYTIPMPVLINGEQFLEDISLTQEQFYEKLKDDSCQVSTSQPSAYDVGELWKNCWKNTTTSCAYLCRAGFLKPVTACSTLPKPSLRAKFLWLTTGAFPLRRRAPFTTR